MTKTNSTLHQGSGWGPPVAIRIGNGPPEYVHDAREALDYLHGRWPIMVGAHMLNAKAKCHDAVEISGGEGLARKAFIAAAVEAEMLI